ncbi:putative ankyrin repeat protein L93 [BeAn 58058 virus]|uniref:putative ankyrin repeat protein L93 n=1 Tax=BeAn 58058 virus TaxID=67082 RepID=UPI000909D7FF|nr:putative ankyrin repeat protein L93 [BeAn 58058 virus]APG58195.1 putative ankyrin repeat protein L93 [BeAn 58058 virus]
MYSCLKTNNIDIIRKELSKYTHHGNDLLLFYIYQLHLYMDTLDKDIIKLLIDYGSSINKINGKDKTILHLYFDKIKNGKQSIEIIKILLDAGVDVHARDAFKRSILHTYFLTQNIELEIIKLLVEYGSNVSDLDGDNKTVVHYYINKFNIDFKILNYLLDNVSDVTPFKYILYYYLRDTLPNKDIIKILIDKFGISLIDGYHIVHHYIRYCHVPDPEIFKLFIDNNVCEDINYYIYSGLEQYINITRNISTKIIINFMKLTVGDSDQYKKEVIKYIYFKM